MDYIVTMADGSAYLAHHGVKGMKWGVWNEETRERRMGRIDRYKTKAKDADTGQKRRKYEKKADYLKELNDPGSTKLNSVYLKDKRNLNRVGMVVAGRQTIAEGIAAVNAGVGLATMTPELVAAGASAVAFVPAVAGLAVSAGAAAATGKLAYDAYKRQKSLSTSLDKRAKPSR